MQGLVIVYYALYLLLLLLLLLLLFLSLVFDRSIIFEGEKAEREKKGKFFILSFNLGFQM